MTQIKAIAKVVIFISMGLFLASRLWNGTLSFYIHPRFNVLTAVTAIGLILVGFVYAQQHRKTILHGEEDPRLDHSHDPFNSHDHNITWIGLTILAIPVILGLIVQPQPLGANALENREINLGSLTSAQAPDSSQLALIDTGGERNILDWLHLFQRSSTPTDFNGETANVVGFVYQDDRFGEDEFMVSRFTVSCCVADAAPIGLIVRWPETAQLAPDTWVEVEGTFEAGEFNGQDMVILTADNVTITEAPAQPYLYQ